MREYLQLHLAEEMRKHEDHEKAEQQRIAEHQAELLSIKAQAISENKLHYNERGEFEFAIAPNGEQSLLNEQQWCEVRTTNFKAWFGDWRRYYTLSHQESLTPAERKELAILQANVSKVLSPNGEPAVFYHGTKWDFEEFRPAHESQKHEGIYFADQIKTARHYAGQTSDGSIDEEARKNFQDVTASRARANKRIFKESWSPWTKKEALENYKILRRQSRNPEEMHSVVMPCFVKATDPLIIDNGARELSWQNNEWGYFDSEVRLYLKQRKRGNYDGILWLNTRDSGPMGTVLNVIHSRQIKSAENNNGLYEESKENINA